MRLENCGCFTLPRIVLLLAVAAIARGPLFGRTEKTEHDRWEPTIQRFEAQDRRQPPSKDGILFIGSSSIVGWNLDEHFPDLPTINRGFGGSQIADSVHFANRIVLPYRPKIIVFYAGAVQAGRTAPQRRRLPAVVKIGAPALEGNLLTKHNPG